MINYIFSIHLLKLEVELILVVENLESIEKQKEEMKNYPESWNNLS